MYGYRRGKRTSGKNGILSIMTARLAMLPVTEDGEKDFSWCVEYRNALDRYTLEIPAGKLDSPDEARLTARTGELEEDGVVTIWNIR